MAKKRKKDEGKIVIVLTTIIIALIIIIGLLLTVLGNIINTNKTFDDISDEKKEKGDITIEYNNENTLVDSNIISNLNNFINRVYEIGNNNDYDLTLRILKGIEFKSLTNYDKFYIASLNLKQDIVDKLPASYNDEMPNSFYNSINIKEYDNNYINIIKEEPVHDISKFEYMSCPQIKSFDENENKIFISNNCGGTVLNTYGSKTIKYTEDNEYYYVYQNIYSKNLCESNINGCLYKISNNEIVDVESFNGNEEKFDTIIWKFNKELHFISTTNIG